MKESEVVVLQIKDYDENKIFEKLPDKIFNMINPGDVVVIKPNWVKESHLGKKQEWNYIITHPAVITAVLKKVITILNKNGKIIITDGPQTDSSFEKIIAHFPVNRWKQMCIDKGIDLKIIDLRYDEWINKGDITIKRKKLPGDPKGEIEINLLDDNSEFFGHKKSKRGYYGADYNIEETNMAHDGHNNLYRVSKTVINADVFINIPKLKTHKKGGITCCLKNLVGINTYKNYLPHHMEGGPSQGGDQFPVNNINAIVEGPIMAFLKQNVLQNTKLAFFFMPIKKLGKKIFGDTSKIIRSGNWYGNDTLWRMVLDLNKILYYAKTDGKMQPGMKNRKKYIGIVDGILGGEGNGPMSPDPVKSNIVLCGTNPVAIDCASARLMGYDPQKIATITNSFSIKNYTLCDFKYKDVSLILNHKEYKIYDKAIDNFIPKFKPHFGWLGNIEWNNANE